MKHPLDLTNTIEAAGGEVLALDDHGDAYGGLALLRCDTPGTRIQVVFASDLGWDHVSACVCSAKGPVRVPSYSEMVRVKRLFFKPDEAAMELHVPEADHINHNDHVLHLWRPHDVEIPMPPKEMV